MSMAAYRSSAVSLVNFKFCEKVLRIPTPRSAVWRCVDIASISSFDFRKGFADRTCMFDVARLILRVARSWMLRSFLRHGGFGAGMGGSVYLIKDWRLRSVTSLIFVGVILRLLPCISRADWAYLLVLCL